ncbi:amino acid adenylation domain-containing protein [Chitinophaga oryzae]|uniref:Amino acid adenylation domain-containing protein n=1 Tax=Chitinophaga oryzae TaxID=2725414 RepID=A0ABX6LKD5_9BACT|nr:non-ribosomal peptide synthetase [Chitinophaga oryzae]QJB39308.1 amino acid adenylation domain-containing protein [Chitinophaga oryzae]
MLSSENIDNIYLLSPMQQGILFHSLLEGAPAYFLQASYRLSGSMDLLAVEKSLQWLVSRHDVLRTVFNYTKAAHPVQIVLKERTPALIFEDLRNIPQEAQNDYLEAFKRTDKDKYFDLRKDILFRVAVLQLADEAYELIWSWHHIIMDGMSQHILMREYLYAYTHFLGEQVPLAPPAFRFRDFIRRITATESETVVSFWKEYLNGYHTLASVPRLPVIPEHMPATESIQDHAYVFDDKQTQKLISLARQQKVTVNLLLQAMWAVILMKYNDTQDVIFGTVVSGRMTDMEGMEEAVGLFINTIPCRFTVDDYCSFAEMLKQAHAGALYQQEYHYASLAEIKNFSDIGEGMLFDHLFVFQQQSLPVIDAAHDTVGKQHDGARYQVTDATAYEKTNYDFIIVFTHENDLRYTITCNDARFAPQIIDNIFHHFNHLITTLSTTPDIPLPAVSLLPSDTLAAVYEPLDNAAVDFPREETIVSLFDQIAGDYPGRIALSAASGDISYGCLSLVSQKLACYLDTKFALPEENIVGCMFDRSEWNPIVIMAILRSGCAYLPVDQEYGIRRIQSVLDDAACTVLVTSVRFMEKLKGLEGVRIVFIEDEWERILQTTPYNLRRPRPDNLAYIIYTSGSQGVPKGMMIEHRNVVRLLFNERFQFDFNRSSIWTLFHSVCFDFSVWEMFGALLYGGKLVILSDADVRDPALVYRKLLYRCVTVLNQVPPIFSVLSDYVRQQPQITPLALRYVIFGGDALQPEALIYWMNYHQGIQFINMYGITETTVHVTFKQITEEDIHRGVSNIGRPIPTLKLLVVDRHHRPVPPGITGEIVVIGAGLGRGYLNRTTLTAERFVNSPAFDGERGYLSGDIGYVNTRGELIYQGRKDNQVKIRGYRIEPDEIKKTIQHYPGIGEVVIVARKELNIVAFIVAKDLKDTHALKVYLSERLPAYMVPSLFVLLEEIPLTSNGKVDYKRLDLMLTAEAGRGPAEGPLTGIKGELQSLWKAFLKMDAVGASDSFFSAGGDSIKAIRLVAEINSKWQTDVQVKDIFMHPDITSLAAVIDGKLKHKKNAEQWEAIIAESEMLRAAILREHAADLPAGWEDFYPIADIQRGMLIQSSLDPQGGTYHDQMFSQFVDPDFDMEAFRDAVRKLVHKHGILRTSFHQARFGIPIQILHKEVTKNIDFINLSALDKTKQQEWLHDVMAADLQHPFSEDVPGLWRLSVYRLGGNDIGMLFACHHAIIDGWSNASFLTELSNLYSQVRKDRTFIPAALKATYKDFVLRQWAAARETSVIEYWQKELSGFSRTPLPFYKTYQEQRKTGATGIARFHVPLDGVVANALIRYSAQRNYNVKSLFFLAFAFMVKFTTGEDEVLLGLVSNNRPETTDGDKILGCFLNTIPVRVKLDTYSGCQRTIADMNHKLNALKHVDCLPLLKMTELVKAHDGKSNPFFDVVFDYLDFHVFSDGAPEVNTTDAMIGDYDKTNTLFDLDIVRWGNHFSVNIKTRPGLYSECELERLGHYYCGILRQFAEECDDLRVEELLSKDEQKQLLAFSCGPVRKVPELKISELICTAHKDDARIAIQHAQNSITYKDLSHRVTVYASWLKHLNGVKAGDIVAVLLPRSIKMIETILALWRCGAVYLPVDYTQPAGRIRQVLDDAAPAFVITDYRIVRTELEELLQGQKVVPLTEEMTEEGLPEVMDDTRIDESTAYVLFTSGSTGAPKGAVIYHRGMMNHIQAKIADLSLDGLTVLAQTAAATFDISVWQMLSPLLTGGKVVIYDQELQLEPVRFIQAVVKDKVTVLQVVPSYLAALLDDIDRYGNDFQLSFLRYLIVTGETIRRELVDRWYARYPDIPLVNAYGPTEASDDITHYFIPVADSCEPVPVGKPVQNMQVYILDRYQQRCPVGVKGEIYAGGAGVGAGYLNRPELTSAFFAALPSGISEQRPVYRTGDTGLFLPDGNIAFYGRKDLQVKVQGHRIELEEVERAIMSLPVVKEVVVVDKKDSSSQVYLTGYYVLWEGKPDSPADIRDLLTSVLPYYMIPRYLIKMDAIPLTTNGKKDRNRLMAITPGDAGESGLPVNNTEKQILQIWTEVLDDKEIGVHDNFFAAGGHSLRANQLAFRIRETFNVEFTLPQVFLKPTIREQAAFLSAAGKQPALCIPLVEHQPFYPLSHQQKQIWLMDQIEAARGAYLLFNAAAIAGEPDMEALTWAFTALIARHESLRTVFVTIQGEPHQQVLEAMAVKPDIRFVDLSDVEERKKPTVIDEITYEASKMPFDLTMAPLFRITLIRTGAENHLLLFSIHHIITDGWSMEVLFHELSLLYHAYGSGTYPLNPLPVQYKDFAMWYHQKVGDKENKSRKYWLDHFSGILPSLEIPVDFPRPARRTYQGAIITRSLDRSGSDHLYRIAAEQRTTIFMNLLTVWEIVFHRVTAQDDIIVGIVDAGRYHPDLLDQIGFFINTWPLRLNIGTEDSYYAILHKVAQRVIAAVENWYFPLDMLIDHLNISSAGGRAPLFDVAISFNDGYVPRSQHVHTGNEIPVVEKSVNQAVYSKYDLIINMWDRQGEIAVEITYNTGLFSAGTIDHLWRLFRKTAELAVALPHVPVRTLSLTDENMPVGELKQQVTEDFNFNF